MNCIRCDKPASPKSRKGYCVDHAREARAAWKEMIANQPTKADKDAAHRDLFDRANAAGHEAAMAAVPRAMLVGTPKNLVGSLVGGDDGGFDTSKPIYYESEGVCGFAWVNIKPGNSSFARWMKDQGQARPDSYYGGVSMWISGYGQSYERKLAYARAFAGVLVQGGIKAYASGRLD